MILAVLQARLSSTRLPGKVLLPVAGEPMIVRQIERIRKSALIDTLVVATSVDVSDDPLADLLASRGLVVRRGPLANVYQRFAEVVDEFNPQTVVRLTGDNPLVDPSVIDLVISAHLASGSDYSSNSLVRTFPYGLDVECMTAEAFRRLGAVALTDEEKEHVTLGLYRRPEYFSLTPVTQSHDHSELRWTVDYPDDLEFVREVYGSLHTSNPDFGQEDVVALIASRPELRRTVGGLAQ